MLTKETLKQKLAGIDSRDYGSYQSLLGSYDFDVFKLIIQQIPKDPYAPPHTGIYRIQVQRSDSRIINTDLKLRLQKIAFSDYLARRFFYACEQVGSRIRGTGYSGLITINQPGQAVLERNCVVLTDSYIEVRCFLGLPANGRKVNPDIAAKMLFDELPEIVYQSLLTENIDQQAMHKHIVVVEDADYLRSRLQELNLVAFIANDSILPRESGTSDKPMSGDKALPFRTPESMLQTIKLPGGEIVKGMGIPKGVTLITGGGYHGKSTLLRTLELGIYNHISGDGRERCVADSGAVKIRAYSGRSVEKTDISPFIKNLPFQKDTTAFCTKNASGSTSQAANIIEAVEMGARVLLMDEDTCATNFMIRDAKMQKLVSKNDEPITAFIDKVKQLFLEKNISTVLVLGGVGDYFDVSDQVIQMVNYKPADVTKKAHAITQQFSTQRKAEDESYPLDIRQRIPEAESINPLNDYGKFAIYAKETQRLNFGNQVIDLTDLEQLVELSQTKAIGFAMDYAKKYMSKNITMNELVHKVIKDIEREGLDVISDKISGHFAGFRVFELAFALNRLRGFKVLQKE